MPTFKFYQMCLVGQTEKSHEKGNYKVGPSPKHLILALYLFSPRWIENRLKVTVHSPTISLYPCKMHCSPWHPDFPLRTDQPNAL